MSEDLSKNNTPPKIEEEVSAEEVKKDFQGFLGSAKKFLSELLDIRTNTDQAATKEAIIADIPFKGHTSWILICSIFIASIGLNANSTAVVIGAMLISPLMGPILGAGMSIAINDIDTLKKSLINLATMIVLSLLTAFLFFKFFPLSEDTSELLGRVKPDIRDVLIAFFGGLALIIARTKKGTIASVIFGVAIATALMPPLCTAGYGLAKGNWEYFLGAMYLFTINTIFIAMATFIVLKVLRFPMLKYVNSKKRNRISKLATLLAIVVMIPAVLTFIQVLKQSGYENDYTAFVKNEITENSELWFQKGTLNPDEKKITLFFNGEITDATEADLINEIKQYEKIRDFSLQINGNKNRSFDKISDAYDRAISDLDKKDNVISGLQKQIVELQVEITNLNETIERNDAQNNSVSFTNLSRDAKVRFSDLQYFSYAKMLESKDFIKIDTITVAHIKWNTSLKDSLALIKEKQLTTWLKQQLKVNTLVVKRVD
mgnify:CR=1 FL=1